MPGLACVDEGGDGDPRAVLGGSVARFRAEGLGGGLDGAVGHGRLGRVPAA